MRILLVDDHRVFASTVAETFLAQHQVEFAGTLNEARTRLSQGRYDFILLDYDLEDRKGTELLGELGCRRRPLVIAISSHEAGNNALLAAGADGVCSKAEFAGIEQVLSAVAEARDAGRSTGADGDVPATRCSDGSC